MAIAAITFRASSRGLSPVPNGCPFTVFATFAAGGAERVCNRVSRWPLAQTLPACNVADCSLLPVFIISRRRRRVKTVRNIAVAATLAGMNVWCGWCGLAAGRRGKRGGRMAAAFCALQRGQRTERATANFLSVGVLVISSSGTLETNTLRTAATWHVRLFCYFEPVLRRATL